jgi:hypothetical protein
MSDESITIGSPIPGPYRVKIQIAGTGTAQMDIGASSFGTAVDKAVGMLDLPKELIRILEVRDMIEDG